MCKDCQQEGIAKGIAKGPPGKAGAGPRLHQEGGAEAKPPRAPRLVQEARRLAIGFRLVANFEYHTASAGMRRLALLQIGALPPSEVHNLTAADWMALERAGHDVAQLKAWAAAHAPPDTGACQTGGAPEATAQTNVSLVELCKHQKEELKRLQVALAVQAAGSDRQALLDKINALESANIVLGRDNCQLVAEKDALLSKDICRNNNMLCEKVESWMDLEKCRSEKSELAQTLDDCHTVLSDTRCDLEIERIGRDKTRKLFQQALFDATTAQEALGSFKERERADRLSLMASMAVDAPDSPPFSDDTCAAE